MEFFCDSDEILERRKRQVFERKEYRRHCEEFGNFQIYALDKLESVFLEANVLDTLHYADTLEIEAFLRHFDLSLLRVHPPGDWKDHPDGIASFQQQVDASGRP